MAKPILRLVKNEPEPVKVCSMCGVGKSLGDFSWNKTKAIYRAECKECNSAKAKEYQKQKRNEDPMYSRGQHLKEKYGISLTQYAEMLESQNHRCAACHELLGRTPKGTKYHPVDHDHATGKIRGIIHGHCNHALGHVKDDPALLMKLAKYLLLS